MPDICLNFGCSLQPLFVHGIAGLLDYVLSDYLWARAGRQALVCKLCTAGIAAYRWRLSEFDVMLMHVHLPWLPTSTSQLTCFRVLCVLIACILPELITILCLLLAVLSSASSASYWANGCHAGPQHPDTARELCRPVVGSPTLAVKQQHHCNGCRRHARHPDGCGRHQSVVDRCSSSR